MNIEDKNISHDDEQLRQLIKSSRMEAPKNLNYRIMQQIETEKVFTGKSVVKKSKLENTIKDIATISGIMYVVLALLAIPAYIMYGKDYLISFPFLNTVLLILLVFALFWLFSRLDAHLQKKNFAKSRRQNHLRHQR